MKIKSYILFIILALSSCDSDNSGGRLACGGGIEFTCPIGMYCQMLENCGGFDSTGYCLPVPKSCPDEEQIICGCDNKEYKNTCIANTQNVSVKNKGLCIKHPEIEVHE